MVLCCFSRFLVSILKVVTERKIGAKHLQTVAGVENGAYWLSTYLWDIFNYQIPVWVTIGLMYLFKVDVLTTGARDTFAGVITLLFFFGPASAGFAYCTSFAFKSASMANICLIITGFLVGMGGTTEELLVRYWGDIAEQSRVLFAFQDLWFVLSWFLLPEIQGTRGHNSKKFRAFLSGCFASYLHFALGMGCTL